MLVAITGTSRGLGQDLARLFARNNHTVHELNRSNGYDIKQPNKIVDAVKDSDVFINNAYDGFGQVDLLYALVQAWEGKKDRYIINIGSERTRRWNVPGVDWKLAPRGAEYRTHKLALTEAVQYLYQQVAWPRLMLVDVGALQTPPSEYWTEYRKSLATIPCDQVAELIIDLLDRRDRYFVSEIVLRPTSFFKE